MILANGGAESYVLFLYQDIQWSTGTTIGFNAGNMANSFTLPEASDDTLTVEIDRTSSVGLNGVYAFRVDQSNITSPAQNVEFRPGKYVNNYRSVNQKVEFRPGKYVNRSELGV